MVPGQYYGGQRVMVRGRGLSEIDVISLYPPRCEVMGNCCRPAGRSYNFLLISRTELLEENEIKAERE